MDQMKRRVSSVVALVVAAMSLSGAASAVLPDYHPAGSDGHDFAFTGDAASELTIRYKPRRDKFVGRLTSDFVDTQGVLEGEADEASVCVSGRKVTVFKVRRHRPNLAVGSDRVSPEGTWSVSKARVRGKYYASVGRSETLLREYFGGIDYYVTCASDLSPALRL
jgi:hypothetical protein